MLSSLKSQTVKRLIALQEGRVRRLLEPLTDQIDLVIDRDELSLLLDLPDADLRAELHEQIEGLGRTVSWLCHASRILLRSPGARDSRISLDPVEDLDLPLDSLESRSRFSQVAASLARCRAYLERIPQPVAILDREATVLDCNWRASQIGVDREEALLRRLPEVLPPLAIVESLIQESLASPGHNVGARVNLEILPGVPRSVQVSLRNYGEEFFLSARSGWR